MLEIGGSFLVELVKPGRLLGQLDPTIIIGLLHVQVAVDSISIPAIHYHGSRRRVLKVLLVLLDLDQNVTALVLGRAYEVAAGVRVERLLLRLQIIQVKF